MAKDKVLLIDGDILLYKIALNNEVPINWGDGLWTLQADENICKADVDAVIENLGSTFSADDYVVCLTDKNNFRKDVLPSYKSNRKDVRKPMMLKTLREYVLEKHNGVVWANLEADDIMGIMATETSEEERIIVSIDKDMKTIPCNLSVDGQNVTEIPLRIADYNFMLQTLTGDKTDGYDGIDGVGIKTAEKLIKKYTNVPLLDLWKVVKGIYVEKGYTEKEALQQARVAHILRDGDYNKKTGEVKLWTI
jgi:5'-3' exonuclease|tara:strand:- start:2523 stop:3272 length:750 start_codon:yes stop_codon:yes gene_type:complete